MKKLQVAIDPALLERAGQVWREAGKKLSFKVTAPFALEVDGKTATYIAFLPDFGSPRGMVVGPMMPPAFDLDPLLVKGAADNGFFYSFMSAIGWEECEEAAVKDALIDWGFFGPDNERPAWLPHPGHVGE